MVVLAVALCQGLLFLFLLPPWQHYDEPTHFEYAWLIADLGRRPDETDVQTPMRREVAASMQEHSFYTAALAPPALLSDDRRIWIGVLELPHPPVYYAVASLPLWLFRHVDMTTQLYLTRCMSLLMLLLTIAVAVGLVRDLTPPGHPLRWLAPLALALLPVFLDIMTAVNNDVGAVLCFSLLLWGCVRVIRSGVTWQRLAWITASAGLGVLTKTTAAVGLFVAPAAVLIALWIQRGWRWRWLALATTLPALLGLVVIVDWDDAAYWYRDARWPVQTVATRADVSSGPLGAYALQLEATPGVSGRRLLNPLLQDSVARIDGQTITFGGWVWASRPTDLGSLGLHLVRRGADEAITITYPLTLTDEPVFVSWTLTLPPDTQAITYVLAAQTPPDDQPPVMLFLDGAVLTPGTFGASTAPSFAQVHALTGTWGERPFTNLLRDGSGEQAWPRLRPWFNELLTRYARRAMSQIPAALLDVDRVGGFLASATLTITFDGLVNRFAWGHVELPGAIWPLLLRILALAATAGCLLHLLRQDVSMTQRAAALFLAGVTGLVWLNTALRPLPLLEGQFVFPATRYTLPVIIPVVLGLTGGWWLLWPRTYRRFAGPVLLAGLLVLNLLSVRAIWDYYQAVVASGPIR